MKQKKPQGPLKSAITKGSTKDVQKALETIDSEIASDIFHIIASRMANNPGESLPKAIDNVTQGFSSNTLRILVKALALRIEDLLQKNKRKR